MSGRSPGSAEAGWKGKEIEGRERVRGPLIVQRRDDECPNQCRDRMGKTQAHGDAIRQAQEDLTLVRDGRGAGCCLFLRKVIEGMVDMETGYSKAVEA